MSYSKRRQDFEYLESLAELEDWVEIDARTLELMRSPDRVTAAQMYLNAIGLWFGEHSDILDDRAFSIRHSYGF